MNPYLFDSDLDYYESLQSWRDKTEDDKEIDYSPYCCQQDCDYWESNCYGRA